MTKIIDQLKKKRVLENIRREFLFFGHNLSHLSDKELEDGIQFTAKAFYNASLTVKEAAKGIEEFNKVWIR